MVCGEMFGTPNRVNRGGIWNNDSRNCSASNRDNNNPDNRNDNLGFRLAVPQHCDFQSVHNPATFLPDKFGEMNEAGFRHIANLKFY